MTTNETKTSFLVRPADGTLAVVFSIIWKPFAYNHKKQQWRPWAPRVPNALTLLRLLLGPPIAVAFIVSMWSVVVGAATTFEVRMFWSFVGIVLTDQIDGPLANFMDCVSAWGKTWDAIADKATTIPAFVGFALLAGRLVEATLLQKLILVAITVDVILYALAWRYGVWVRRLGGRSDQHVAQASPPGRWKFGFYAIGMAATGVYLVWNPTWLAACGGLRVAVVCFGVGVPLGVWSLFYHWRELTRVKKLAVA